MTSRYRSQLYPVLARLDAERSHRLALRSLATAERAPGGLRLLRRFAPPPDPRLRVERWGLSFPNPLGVAAGLDKNAEAVAALFALGFGAVEIGTVTPRPQPGNPAPRLWRFPEQQALVNALGFPSEGAAAVRRRLAGRRFPGVVGVNLGKNRDTPPERAVEDYLAVLEALWDVAGYLTVNVSSPNTPGLRDLQRPEALRALLGAVVEHDALLARLHGGRPHPVLVKLAPDLDERQLADALESLTAAGAAGVILGNTTTSRAGLPPASRELPGGVSGAPLGARNLELLGAARRLAPELPLVAAGGIDSAADVIARLRAGAGLAQLYTGFIYGGPALPGEILAGLSAFMDRHGSRSIGEIEGAEAPVIVMAKEGGGT
ncbi:MAG TPA: quinone-dependent dihydroorotate dehydrogenase [Thermomicrobiaceae bacterium]|nr:quinone-dependent dihydroorotate dehydrogenase [Thermomicrobiaceae bacterium]